MAWSEKAVADGVKAWLESDPSMTNEYVIMRILDAAAAVDGDAQREALAQFMLKHSYPTGHGDTHADLLAELDAAIQESGDAQWNEGYKAGYKAAKDEENAAEP